MIEAKEFDYPDRNLLSEYLPWSFLSAPGVMEHKDGALQKTFSFRGPDLESATKRELMSMSAAFNNAMRRLPKGWAIFLEAQRNPIEDYPKSIWPNEACKKIDEEREKLFCGKEKFFNNDYFLTFVYAQPKAVESKGASWFFTKDKTEVSNSQSIKDFANTLAQIEGILTGVFASFKALNDDETLTYLHSTTSSGRFAVKTPDIPMYLDHILSDEQVEHGLGLKVGNNFFKTISINAFPSESFPGILHRLNELSFSFRWSTRFIPLGYESGKKKLEDIRRMWFAGRKKISTVLQEIASQSESVMSESGALNKSDDADCALLLLEEGQVSFGQFTATISVWDQNEKLACEKAQEVLATINRLGFTAHIEKLNAFEAWLSSLPGNTYANVRKPIIHTLNFAHLAPLSAKWLGEKQNTHLKASPHFMATCSGNSPFRFSSNVGDVGHTLIFGPTGAGKSTLLSFMAAQWMKYENAQVFFFDKGYSSRVLTECVGGSFFVVGGKFERNCFQPLRNIDDESERIWASEWLQEILSDQNIAIDVEVKSEIWEALNNLVEQSVESRTMSVFCSLIQSQEIRDALSDYTLAGPYGYIFDASEESDDKCSWQSFETAELFDKKGACKAALSYLFHRLQKRFDGRPTLLILDEAWLFLENSSFAKKIKQWLKELRKSNVYVIFATQSLSDAMQSPIAMALKESCPTKIFLPNNSAQDESSAEFYRTMGLNEKQIEIIAKAAAKREYYVSSPKGHCLFDLALGPVALALCASSSVDDQKRLREIKAKVSKTNFLDAYLGSYEVCV